jgi:hypothetical protein
VNRRRLLAAASASLAGVAGCGQLRESAATTTTRPAETTTAEQARRDAENALAEPRGFVVRNRGETVRYVTVAVFDGDRAAVSRTFEVAAGASASVGDAVAAAGTYRVVVETADGAQAVREWQVTPETGNLEVLVGDGVAFWEAMRCAPACPAGQGGVSTRLPYKDGATDREPATLVVENAADDARRVSVTVADLHTTVLDYDYEVPARTRLRVPVTAAEDVYAVTARASGETREYTWSVPEAERVFVRVGGGLRVDCGEASGTLRLTNRDDDPHHLRVVVSDDDDAVFDRTIRLPPGAETTVENAVQSSGRYRLEASTVDGASATDDWWVCPPVARKLVQIHKWGGVVVGRTGLS